MSILHDLEKLGIMVNGFIVRLIPDLMSLSFEGWA
jgi:hypothetical protein